MILLTRAVILAAIKIELVLRRLVRIDSDHKPPAPIITRGDPRPSMIGYMLGSGVICIPH